MSNKKEKNKSSRNRSDSQVEAGIVRKMKRIYKSSGIKGIYDWHLRVKTSATNICVGRAVDTQRNIFMPMKKVKALIGYSL